MLLEHHLNGALTMAESPGRDDVGVVKTGINGLVDDFDGVPGGRSCGVTRRHAPPPQD